MDTDIACVLCGRDELRTVSVIEALPVHVGVLWRSAEEARRCPTGEMRLSFCPACGMLANTAYDPDLLDYTLEYDNSLHASAIFRLFEAGLVEDLITRHDLHGKRIVEVGGGGGRFLGLLCDAGDNTGIGFDPSIGTDRTLSDGRVELKARFFTESTELDPFDLLCCRQVLEHVPEPLAFLAPISATMRDHADAVAYFDVPNTSMLLEDLSIWDLIYEHCLYFVEGSLGSTMSAAGLTPERVWESFDGQFLSVEARSSRAGAVTTPGDLPPASDALVAAVDAFAGHLERRRAEWADRLASIRARGERIAVWGAGARAVTFFAMLGITDEVAYLVDANEAKQGTYLAGSGHPILAPRRLTEDPVDSVVIVNGIYEKEIGDLLQEMGVASNLVVA